MRILHVLDVSIPMLAGYATRSRYIADAQRSLGWEPVVLTTVRQENPKRVEMEEIDGLPYYRSVSPDPRTLRGRIDRIPVLRVAAEVDALRRRVIEVARQVKPDVIHAHSSIICGIPGLLAARHLGVPYVYEIRSFWEDAAVDLGRTTVGAPRYRATRQAETSLANRADAVVTICDGMGADLEERGIPAAHIHVIPNGVDTERFIPLERDEELAKKYGLEGKIVISYIGTFAPFEGVPTLVKALVDLIKGGRDDLRGLIVGQGRCYEECRRIAADAGLGDKILHPGRVPHSEVQLFYSVTDILVYPRVRQRLTELVTPLKPLEAMAMGKVVVGTDVGGLAELITHETTGLLYPAEEPEALVAAIVRLASDDDLRATLARHGREYVCEDRQWSDIVQGHTQLYEGARQRCDNRGNRRPRAPRSADR